MSSKYDTRGVFFRVCDVKMCFCQKKADSSEQARDVIGLAWEPGGSNDKSGPTWRTTQVLGSVPGTPDLGQCHWMSIFQEQPRTTKASPLSLSLSSSLFMCMSFTQRWSNGCDIILAMNEGVEIYVERLRRRRRCSWRRRQQQGLLDKARQTRQGWRMKWMSFIISLLCVCECCDVTTKFRQMSPFTTAVKKWMNEWMFWAKKLWTHPDLQLFSSLTGKKADDKRKE